MRKSFLLWLFLSSFLLGVVTALYTETARAATSTHIVISEVQTGLTSSVSADFVELYNPTSLAINLDSYRLVKRSSTGTSDTGIVAFNTSDIIPAHGFFLWCNTSISSLLGCDKNTTATVANGNSIGLRNGPINTGIIVDALTLGTVTSALGEGTPLPTIAVGSSFERKARSDSTIASMQGSDALFGNSEDTDNNILDFVLRSIPGPQSTSSATEELPTPTVTPTQVPTETPTPTFEPTPTELPTPTLTPTDMPTPTLTPTPTLEPTPTVTLAPTLTPTLTLAPTATVTPTLEITLTPSATVTPTLTATIKPEQNYQLACSTRVISFQILRYTIRIPYLTCGLVKI